MNNKEIESKDCPLCGMKGCITLPERRMELKSRNDGEYGRIGNYNIITSGGEWDYSHADVCTKLENVFKKQELLEYYVTTIQTIKDTWNASDYQLALHKIHYTIESKNVLDINNCNWTVETFIKRTGLNNDKILLTKGLFPETAFETLRYRILCGEVWELGGEKFQFHQNTEGDGIFKIYFIKVDDTPEIS